MRFEDHRRHRFFEVEQADAMLVRRFGRLGTDGASRVEVHAAARLAASAMMHQEKRAWRKGYWPGHHNPQLVERIAESPDDPGAYLVYADWLEERADPRAAWIRAHHKRAKKTIAALTATHRRALVPGQRHDGLVLPTHWTMGFVRVLTVMSLPAYFGAQLPGMVQGWIDHPSCQVLRAVDFRRVTADGRASLDLFAPLLGELPCLTTVRVPEAWVGPWTDRLGALVRGG